MIPFALVFFLFLIPPVAAQEPFYEIVIPENQQILDFSLTKNSACWLETDNPQQARVKKWTGQPISIRLKTARFIETAVSEEILWDSSVASNTITHHQAGLGYLSFTYTNQDLIPRRKTLIAKSYQGRWKISRRLPRSPSPIPRINLEQQNKQIILKKQGGLKKILQITEEGWLSLILDSTFDQNQTQFVMELETELSEFGLEALREPSSVYQEPDGTLLLFTGKQGHVLVFFDPLNQGLLEGLQNHITTLSHRHDLFSQVEVLKQMTLLKQFQATESWSEGQRLAVESFVAQVTDRLQTTLITFTRPDNNFTLLVSPWQNMAYVLPKKVSLQPLANHSVLRLETPGHQSLYYAKVTLSHFIPTPSEQTDLQKAVNQQLGKVMPLTFKAGVRPPAALTLTHQPDEIASVKIQPLYAQGEQLVLWFSLESREAKFFEIALNQGLYLNFVVNNQALGFETIGQHVIPMTLQITGDRLQSLSIDRDYPIALELSADLLTTLYQRRSKPKLEVRYQGRIKTVSLQQNQGQYTVNYILERDHNNEPIYRFQYRFNLGTQQTDWQSSDFPFALIDSL